MLIIGRGVRSCKDCGREHNFQTQHLLQTFYFNILQGLQTDPNSPAPVTLTSLVREPLSSLLTRRGDFLFHTHPHFTAPWNALYRCKYMRQNWTDMKQEQLTTLKPIPCQEYSWHSTLYSLGCQEERKKDKKKERRKVWVKTWRNWNLHTSLVKLLRYS